MNATLGNINLFVHDIEDIERARRFYTEVLRLVENEERSAPPSFILLDAGGCTLTLQDSSAPGDAFGGADSVELGFSVEDIEAVRSRLKAWGGEISAAFIRSQSRL